MFVRIDKNSGLCYIKNMDTIFLVQELKKVGLSDKAATIYAAVLDSGVAFPSKIAEVTKLNRSTVYAILTDLAIKGLVTEIERNKKLCYQVERPGKLINFAKIQIGLAEDRFERAKKLLPEIEGLFSLVPNKPRVRYFEGLAGILSMYEDHINEKDSYEMVGFSNVEALVQFLPEKLMKHYVMAKERLGITSRGIFPKGTVSDNYNRVAYRGVDKKTLVKARSIPADMFPYKGEITVYGKNKVSIINFQENILIGVIIEDKMIADMMRMIFELSWQGAKGMKK